jgi:aromatic ring-cleaving dioxygenase
MQRYHAHIYYQAHEILAIQQLKHEAAESPLRVWKLFEQCVGPHALPMLELHFEGEVRAEAIRWLSDHRGLFSVLIHEDTGDDVKDHEQASWLGEVLPIHFAFFDLVKQNPQLAIHPVP